MKITAIKTFVARFGNRPRALLKVETDEGLYGWGEAYSTGPDLSVKPVADYLFEMIKGEDPRRIEYILMKLMQPVYGDDNCDRLNPLFQIRKEARWRAQGLSLSRGK